MMLPIMMLLSSLLSLLIRAVDAGTPPPHTSGVWSAAPHATPSDHCPDGPVLGNGAVAVAVSAKNGSLEFHIDRNDAWIPATGDISACGYDIVKAGARTLGSVSVSFVAAAGGDFSATQLIANGTVQTAQSTAHGGMLRTSSWVARGTDVVVTELWWDCQGGAACGSQQLAVAVANAQAGSNSFCHSFEQGELWSSRTLGHPYQNVNSTIGRRHFYKAAWATVVSAAEGPPPGPPPPLGPPPPPAPCTDFDGDCEACTRARDNRTRWPGHCVQLNGTLQDMGELHTCVPASWWTQCAWRFPPRLLCCIAGA